VADQLRPVRTCLIGQPSEVANVLRSAQRRGHLVEYGKPRPMSGYRVAVDVTLMQPAKAAPTPRPATRPAERPAQRLTVSGRTCARVGAVTSAVGVLSGLTYGAWVVFQWVAAHWLQVVGVAAAVLMVAAYLFLRSRGGCAGLHCDGCGH